MSMMQVYVTLDQYNGMEGESLVSLFAYGAKNVRYTGNVSIIKLASVLGVNAPIGTKVRQRGLEMVMSNPGTTIAPFGPSATIFKLENHR